jgi:hypothetical protein
MMVDISSIRPNDGASSSLPDPTNDQFHVDSSEDGNRVAASSHPAKDSNDNDNDNEKRILACSLPSRFTHRAAKRSKRPSITLNCSMEADSPDLSIDHIEFDNNSNPADIEAASNRLVLSTATMYTTKLISLRLTLSNYLYCTVVSLRSVAFF